MIKALLTIILISIACQQAQTQPFKVATDPTSPPFSFLQDGSPDPVGFEIDLLAAVAKAANFEYQIVQVPWANLFEQVTGSQVDFAVSGITITDDRKETNDFSVPYFISTHEILAKQETDITSAQDLVNKIVAVRNGTTAALAVENIFGGDNANILKFATQGEGIQALIDGKADAYVDDNGPIDYYVKNNAGFTVITDPIAFERELYGFMFPKGSDLVSMVNAGITAVLENGEYAMIYVDWFKSEPDVDLLLAAGQDADPYDVFSEGQEEGITEEEEPEIEWIEVEVELDTEPFN